ncbi:hypothetical protein RB653_000098 [Dictyostelium firmibasis]|uniref:Ubiquitin-like domain-containing protein n=1 Tax=Dictyostelium firmibasis TaxID=79012 RepID=A0AAN7Z0X6_9MYCE
MNIIICIHPNNKRIELTFDDTDTIESIKNSIKIMEGIKLEEQKIVYDGKALKDSSTLKSNGIKDGSVINVLFVKSSNYLNY